MANVPNRTAKEKRLAALIRRVYGRHRQELIEALGEPPNIDNVSDKLLRKIEDDLTNEAKKVLVILWLLAANDMVDQFGYSPSSTWAAKQARKYADKAAKRMAGSMVDTLADRMDSASAKAAEDLAAGRPWKSNLADSVREAMQSQSESAAVTETTAAHATAETEYAKRHNRWAETEAGQEVETKKIVAYWQTEEDERVCPICRPLDNQPEKIWLHVYPHGPPGHVRCRCWLEWR